MQQEDIGGRSDHSVSSVVLLTVAQLKRNTGKGYWFDGFEKKNKLVHDKFRTSYYLVQNLDAVTNLALQKNSRNRTRNEAPRVLQKPPQKVSEIRACSTIQGSYFQS